MTETAAAFARPASTSARSREALPLAARRQGRHHHAQPPGAQEPAHLRILRRAARHVSRARLRGRASRPSCSPAPAATSAPAATCTRSSGRSSRCRARATCRAAALHAHDRRPGEGDARLPAADRRGGRRHLRRRRRHPRDGLATCARHAAQQGRVPVRARRPRRAPTWARAPSCRASSARAAPPSCSTPAARWTAPKPSAGASTTGCASRTRCSTEAPALARSLADGPTFAHAMTKRCLHQEWSMGIDEAIEAEAAGAGDLHADQGFRARLPRVRREAAAGVRRRLMTSDGVMG